MVCSKCGAIVVMDNIPRGQQLLIREDELSKNVNSSN